MKKAINTWSFPAEWSLEKKLQVAAEAGFTGFELELSADGPVCPHSTSSDLASVRSMLKDCSLAPTGLATGLSWHTNPVSDDAATRAKAEFYLRRQLECASDLEVDAILVVPGVVGADFVPDLQPVRYDIALDRARTFIEKALPTAERLGVTIGLENVWNRFLLSPVELQGFIDSFASPRVGAYLDIGNVLAMGYPEHWIPILSHRIVRVHLKDYRRSIGTVDGFVELLSGDVNWPAVVAELRNVGYSGWVAAEMVPPVPFYKHCPETLIYNTARAMDQILAL